MGGTERVFTCNIVSGTSQSTPIDLGSSWKRVYLNIGSMSNPIMLYTAATFDGTYRRIRHQVNGSTATVEAPSTFMAFTTGMSSVVRVPSGFRYLRLDCSAVQANGLNVNVLCSN